MTRSLRALLVTTAGVCSLAIAACSPPHEVDSGEKIDTASQVAVPSSSSSATSSSSAAAEATAVSFTKAYVKAKPGDKSMTAIFGTLTNNTDAPITIVGFNSDLFAGENQIHEVVDGVMREREGGITIEPGASHVLEPGGDHLMLMDISRAIDAGDVVELTLILDDGTAITIPDVPVRTINAGEEDYGEDGQLHGTTHKDHGDHKDHGGHGDHSTHKH